MGVECQSDGIGLPADRERKAFQFWFGRCNRFADFKHVRAKNFITVDAEMVGVILYERGTAFQSGTHDFMARTRAEVFQSPSAPKLYPLRINC